MPILELTRNARSLLSLNRDREIAVINRLLALKSDDFLLDVGTGDGFWTQRFSFRCKNIVGLEPDLQLLMLAHKLHPGPRLQYMRSVAEQIPIVGNIFDKIVSVSCLEHFGDPFQGLFEMSRVLKPGGRLAISVDSLLPENSSTSFREWHSRRHYVTQYFKLSELEDMVRKAGLIYEPENTVHLFRSRSAARLREVFIRSPRLLLPLFPIFYYLIRWLDSIQNQMHGQILIISARKPTSAA